MAPKRRKLHKQSQWFGESDGAFLSAETLQFIHDEKIKLFNKTFTLKTKENTWALPDARFLFTTEPESIQELLEMKQTLNETKSLLNDIDIVEWHQHTRRMHKAGLVVKTLRETQHAEMCTQAFAKLYEVLATYDPVPQDAVAKGTIFSVHLCEAPGAFVAAMNHYLKNHHPDLDWAWLATTLNPYYESHSLRALLDDDRFIVETLENWNFGADGTGDLMKLNNLKNMQQACAAKGAVHLVTADGSIDCADEPEEQERDVSQLIFCEAVATLALLHKGGCYVFKMFTAFEHSMICLMYFMVCVFDEVHIIKPGTSKAGNSEVYVACCGYVGSLPVEYQDILHSAYQSHCPDKAMFPLHLIPEEFLASIKEYQAYFTQLQIQEITTNIQHFYHINRLERKELFHLRSHAASYYVEKFGVNPIRDEERVITGAYLDGTQLSYTRGPSYNVPIEEPFTGRRKTGTYNQRQELQQHGWLDSVMEDELFTCNPTACANLQGLAHTNHGTRLIPLSCDDVEWLPMPITPLQDSQLSHTLKITQGQTLDQVRNSRFCTPVYVTRLNEAKEHAMVLKPNQAADLQGIAEATSPAYIACCLNSKGHCCDVYSLATLDRLVGFTDVKGGSKIVAVSHWEGRECDCLLGYLKFHDLVVQVFSQDNVDRGRNRGDSTEHESSTDLKQPGSICTQSSPINATDQVGLFLCFLDEGAVIKPTEGLQIPLELTTKVQLIQQCIHAMTRLNNGGTFVCQLFDCLTRFTVGVIYILHHLFSQTTIVKPVVSHLLHPERYLVCKGYQGCSDEILRYLEHILVGLKVVNHPGMSICQPMQDVDRMTIDNQSHVGHDSSLCTNDMTSAGQHLSTVNHDAPSSNQQVLSVNQDMTSTNQRLLPVNQNATTVSQYLLTDEPMKAGNEETRSTSQPESDVSHSNRAANQAESSTNRHVSTVNQDTTSASQHLSIVDEPMKAVNEDARPASQDHSATGHLLGAANNPDSSTNQQILPINQDMASASQHLSVDQPIKAVNEDTRIASQDESVTSHSLGAANTSNPSTNQQIMPVNQDTISAGQHLSIVDEAMKAVNEAARPAIQGDSAISPSLGAANKPEVQYDILEIVPVYYLYDSNFYQFIKKTNEQLCHLQLHNIIRLEMFYQFPEDIPNNDEKEKLRSDIAKYLSI